MRAYTCEQGSKVGEEGVGQKILSRLHPQCGAQLGAQSPKPSQRLLTD